MRLNLTPDLRNSAGFASLFHMQTKYSLEIIIIIINTLLLYSIRRYAMITNHDYTSI